MAISEDIRQELIRLAGSRRTRRSDFTREAPCDWSPHSVLDPVSNEPFTDEGAWTFIVTWLQKLTLDEIHVVELMKPPGKRAYAFVVQGATGQPEIYVKLQIVSGAVRARSFHCSKKNNQTEAR